MCGRLVVVAKLADLYRYLALLANPPEGGIERYNLPQSYQRGGEVLREQVLVWVTWKGKGG